MTELSSYDPFVPPSVAARHDVIALTAYYASEHGPYAPDAVAQWCEAERCIDDGMFRQALTARDRYRSVAIKFFTSVQNEPRLRGEGLAERYLELLRTARWQVTEWHEPIAGQDPDRVGILDGGSRLQDASDLLLRSEGTSLLSHSGPLHEYKRTYIYHDPVYDFAQTNYYSTTCPDLDELGHWLRANEDALTSGRILYAPKITHRQRIDSVANAYLDEGWDSPSIDPLRDALERGVPGVGGSSA